MSAGDASPVLRIVRGTPTPEEVAALVGALFSRSPGAAADSPAPDSAWVRSARPGAFDRSGLPARPGRAGWRASTLPR
jgi:hypothetical protein